MEINLVAQLVGVVGVIFSIMIYQVAKRDHMLSLRIAGSGTLSLHFFLLNAPTGSVMNFLGMVRTVIFQQRTKKEWADHSGWLYLFLGLVVAAAAYFWEGWISLLPMWGLIFGTLAFWSKDPRTIRFLNLLPPPAWFVYDLIKGSYPGMFVEIIMITSVIVGIVRFDILHKKGPQPKLPD